MVRPDGRPRGDDPRARDRLSAALAVGTRDRPIARSPRARARDRLIPAESIAAGARAVADLLLPLACAACGEGVERGAPGIVCGRCWSRLAVLPAPRCARCGHPTWGRDCRWCAALPPFVRAGRSVCWATSGSERGSGRAIVHALKYGGWHRVADEMAERMARLDWPLDVQKERAAIVPIPLAASRARQRGYNQSERLAHALARRWQLAVWDDVVTRVRETVSQTRLSPEERAGNVHGAFAVTATTRALRGAHVVLVDDVVTTGATLVACAAALCAGGARIVSFVTFGRAPALGDRC